MQPQATEGFGPFLKGVIDRANPGTIPAGAMRAAAGLCFDGVSRMLTRLGTQLQLTLMDDAGAPVTSVCGVGPYLDRAYAVAHSTNTNKVYFYLLTSTMDGWYDNGGALHANNATPQPAIAIWTGTSVPPDVFVVEALGWCYFAHSAALDHTGLYFVSKQWDGTYPVTLNPIPASGTNGTAGTDQAYFLGLISFQQHLWGWGYGSGSTPDLAYRPELARFSQPNFNPFQLADSITLGTRVRSEREKITCAGIAGESMILAGPYILTRVTGQGRQSWYKQPVDQSRGIMGPKAGVSDGPTFYYVGPMGPERVSESGPADPLWYAIENVWATVINPEKIVVTREELFEEVVFHVDTGNGVRTRLSFNTQFNLWLGPDDDGLVLRAGGNVDVVHASVSPGVPPPSAAPTLPASTDGIGATTATLHWTIGDPTSATQVEYRIVGLPTFTVVTVVGAGINSYILTGLTENTNYEWRVAHVKASQYSAYLGPIPATQFTTAASDATLLPPSALAARRDVPPSGSGFGPMVLDVSWTNSGASGVSTEVYVQGEPSSPSAYRLAATVSPGGSSVAITVGYTPGLTTAYQVQVRHVRDSATSPYAGPVTVTL